MKSILLTLVIFVSLLATDTTMAQTIEIPKLPEGKEEFIQSEKDFKALAKWLETTALGTDTDNCTLVNAWVVTWVTNSPTVTVEIRSAIIKAFDKNAQMIAVFLGGYSSYSLENNYSKDELKCNTAGLKAVINCYSLGGDLKKDKNLEKLIEKDKENKLEEWVKDAMSKK